MARRVLLDGDMLPLVIRLWRKWLKPHAPRLAIVLLLVAVTAAATALYPVLIARAYDAFAARDTAALAYGPLLVIAVTATKGFALLGQTVLTNRVVTRIEADMQAALYARLVDLDLAQLGRESPASLTQRFTTDFAFIREALTRLSTVLARDTAMIVALVAAMLWIDPGLTLAAALTVPLVALPIGRIGRRLRQVSRETQEQAGRTAGLIAESLSGARVAKTYALEGYLKARARDAFEAVRRLRMKAANARGRLDPLLEVGGGLAVAGVLALIGGRIVSGTSTVGEFTGFVTALLLAAQPARALGNLNAILQEAVAALERTFAILDEAPTIVDRPGAVDLVVGAGEVRFEGVRFRHRPDAPALEGVDLVAGAGATTALVGRSGSGKSTLLALVPRLHDVDGGRVTIDGQDVRDVTLASLRAAVALVSQEVVLFDDTVRANIAFGRPGADDAAVETAAQAAAAHDFIARLPERYAFRVGPAGGRLSGGERQRVALARAFLKDAPILLLDEATSALDAESERAVQEALARLMRGRTTLLVAHRLSTVRDADRIAVMEAGRVVEEGRPSVLAAAGGAYARLRDIQVEGLQVDGLQGADRAAAAPVATLSRLTPGA